MDIRVLTEEDLGELLALCVGRCRSTGGACVCCTTASSTSRSTGLSTNSRRGKTATSSA
ncbi:MAG: hypothetical protein WKH64_05250 [Chloroflexia bacterium]